jgi:hypothetical protein
MRNGSLAVRASQIGGSMNMTYFQQATISGAAKLCLGRQRFLAL